ncbi:MAG: GH32 C-terminal domain-containing protein [Planctomycetota bacterium]
MPNTRLTTLWIVFARLSQRAMRLGVVILLTMGCFGGQAQAQAVRFVGEAPTPDALDPEAAAAWGYASASLGAAYLPVDDLHTLVQLNEAQVLWWHHTRPELPAPAQSDAALAAVNHFVEAGGGLLLTGFGPRYAERLDCAPFPDRLRNRPTVSAQGGFAQQVDHPLFEGLPETFSVLSDGLPVRGATALWSDPARFPGVWLADLEDGAGHVAIGELPRGQGRVLTIGAPAFAWDTGGAVNLHRLYLQRLTRNAVAYLRADLDPAKPKALVRFGPVTGRWTLDPATGSATQESVSGENDVVASAMRAPAWRPGVVDQALEFDGHSTYVIGPSAESARQASELSVHAWCAVRAYPSAMAPIAAQRTPGAGFALGIDAHGRPTAWLVAGGSAVVLTSEAVLPKGTWVHLALSASVVDGAKLYVNGVVAAESAALSGPIQLPADTPLMIGRDPLTPLIEGRFATGMFNGLIDEVVITTGQIDEDGLAQAVSAMPDDAPDLSVAGRYADDPHRPRFHATPQAGWLGGPSGLMFRDGRYRVWSAVHPSGPYRGVTRISGWISDDLVAWTPDLVLLEPSANTWNDDGLTPGSVVQGEGQSLRFYTGASGTTAGVGAIEGFGDSPDTRAAGEPLVISGADGVADGFGDPFVWRDAATGEARMLVAGGGRAGRGVLYGYGSSDLSSWASLGVVFEDPDPRDLAGTAWGSPWVVKAPGGLSLLGITEPPTQMWHWSGAWQNDRFVPSAPEPTPTDLLPGVIQMTVAPDADGELAALGWMPEARDAGERLAAGWAHCFTLPRRWQIDEQGRLHQSPHPNLVRLRGDPTEVAPHRLLPGKAVELRPDFGDACEVEVQVDRGEADRIELSIRRTPGGGEETILGFHFDPQSVSLDRTRSSLTNGYLGDTQTGLLDARLVMPRDDGRVTLRVFIDRSAIDGFVNDREAFGTRVYPTKPDAMGIRLSAHGGPAEVRSFKVWPMRVKALE